MDAVLLDGAFLVGVPRSTTPSREPIADSREETRLFTLRAAATGRQRWTKERGGKNERPACLDQPTHPTAAAAAVVECEQQAARPTKRASGGSSPQRAPPSILGAEARSSSLNEAHAHRRASLSLAHFPLRRNSSFPPNTLFPHRHHPQRRRRPTGSACRGPLARPRKSSARASRPTWAGLRERFSPTVRGRRGAASSHSIGSCSSDRVYGPILSPDRARTSERRWCGVPERAINGQPPKQAGSKHRSRTRRREAAWTPSRTRSPMTCIHHPFHGEEPSRPAAARHSSWAGDVRTLTHPLTDSPHRMSMWRSRQGSGKRLLALGGFVVGAQRALSQRRRLERQPTSALRDAHVNGCRCSGRARRGRGFGARAGQASIAVQGWNCETWSVAVCLSVCPSRTSDNHLARTHLNVSRLPPAARARPRPVRTNRGLTNRG